MIASVQLAPQPGGATEGCLGLLFDRCTRTETCERGLLVFQTHPGVATARRCRVRASRSAEDPRRWCTRLGFTPFWRLGGLEEDVQGSTKAVHDSHEPSAIAPAVPPEGGGGGLVLDPLRPCDEPLPTPPNRLFYAKSAPRLAQRPPPPGPRRLLLFRLQRRGAALLPGRPSGASALGASPHQRI